MVDIKRNNLSITNSMSDLKNEIYQKLTEAQTEAMSNPRCFSHDEVFGPLRQKFTGYEIYLNKFR